MQLQSISQVSKVFRISTRTLRYYEQIGLLPSVKKEDYAYRTYDENALLRLQQIVILRKLRIPLKQIADILKNDDAVLALQVFQNNLNEIDEEITALSTNKSILVNFISHLNKSVSAPVKLDLFGEESILKIVDTLAITKINLKEKNPMGELNKADESLSKLKDVRIVYLPPETIAASHYIGDDPEMHASMALDKFVRDNNLVKVKPDLRHYGFNHPNPVDESGYHGYEMWVTVPDDMEVPAPLEKRRFSGGLYAAHMIKMGDFHEWNWLIKWVYNSDKYNYNGELDSNGNMTDGEHMHGLLEEHLNYINHVNLPNTEPDGMQLDLLMPVKEK